ncbi:ArsR/SmtB family transcription factor [Devosia chinhatensis]|uniref:ArsR/SmtB family transcription factor n=1 Tax=Devosia chinhatensis TaxID=429727 RepID=UPI0006967B3E|nr:metalloregulator ArsR/SmtB family transcription factor [Devosia chinhatensis]
MSRKTKAPIALYSALADATRCRILEILADGPIPVHRLADAFAISRPAISRHLRVLKEAGLVAEVKKGRENLYAFRSKKLDKAQAWIAVMAAPRDVSAQVETPVAADAGRPNVSPVIEITAAGVEPAPQKPTRKPVRPPEPAAVALNQMGFDF